MPAKPKRRPSGAEAIRRSGRVAVQVPLTQEQADVIEAARAIDGRNKSAFIAHYAALAAKRIVSEKT